MGGGASTHNGGVRRERRRSSSSSASSASSWLRKPRKRGRASSTTMMPAVANNNTILAAAVAAHDEAGSMRRQSDGGAGGGPESGATSGTSLLSRLGFRMSGFSSDSFGSGASSLSGSPGGSFESQVSEQVSKAEEWGWFENLSLDETSQEQAKIVKELNKRLHPTMVAELEECAEVDAQRRRVLLGLIRLHETSAPELFERIARSFIRNFSHFPVCIVSFFDDERRWYGGDPQLVGRGQVCLRPSANSAMAVVAGFEHHGAGGSGGGGGGGRGGAASSASGLSTSNVRDQCAFFAEEMSQAATRGSVFVVSDLRSTRFASSHLVANEPFLNFFASAALHLPLRHPSAGGGTGSAGGGGGAAASAVELGNGGGSGSGSAGSSNPPAVVQIGSVVVFDRSPPGAPGRTGLSNAETAQLLRFARDASELLLEARRASAAGETELYQQHEQQQFQPQQPQQPEQPQQRQQQESPSQHQMGIETQLLDIDWILNGGPSDLSNLQFDLGLIGNGESIALHEI